MYSFFSPPGSPKSPKFRRSALPSTHDHLLHHSHQRSSSPSLASLRSLAQLPETSQQRRRLARSLVFFGSLLVITFVLVSRGVQPVWLRNLQESSEGFSSQVLLRREEHLAQVALQAAGLPIFEGQGSLPTVTSIVTPPSDPLTPAEELAGVVHFLISNHHGVLPPAALLPSYAPSSTPLLAEWVLDFEPGPKGARRNEMMAAFQDEVWTEDANFIVLGRHRSDEVFFKDMQKFLKDEYLVARSEFVFLDVDGRDDSGVLEHVLQRLLKTSTLPSVLLAGTRVGTFEDLKALHEAGKLKALLQRASVRFEKPKKDKVLKQAVVKRRL